MPKTKTKKKDSKVNSSIHTEKVKKLTRSSSDKIIGGVCGGLAEYFDIDPIIIRLIFAIIGLTAGSGVLVYLVLWVVMPEESDTQKSGKEIVEKNAREVEQVLTDTVDKVGNNTSKRTLQILFGLAVMFFGVYLVLLNFGLERYFNFIWFVGRLWPIFIIALGLYILLKDRDEK